MICDSNIARVADDAKTGVQTVGLVRVTVDGAKRLQCYPEGLVQA